MRLVRCGSSVGRFRFGLEHDQLNAFIRPMTDFVLYDGMDLEGRGQ